MAKAIRFHETGGPEVLKLETVEVGEPGPGQARVRHSFIAVNFIDIYFRTGRYPLPLPAGVGRVSDRMQSASSKLSALASPISRSAIASATCSDRRVPTRM